MPLLYHLAFCEKFCRLIPTMKAYASINISSKNKFDLGLLLKFRNDDSDFDFQVYLELDFSVLSRVSIWSPKKTEVENYSQYSILLR